MAFGQFYERSCSEGTEFEVVLLRPAEREQCIRDLRAVGIQVRDDAVLGDFTIHLENALAWEAIGKVVAGSIVSSEVPAR